jgi:proton glutamate symport protein
LQKLKLHWQIFIALLLGVMAGLMTGAESVWLGLRIYAFYEFAGTLFLNALKMLIVPLIFSSIVVGISGVSNQGGVGRLGSKTLAYYLFTSTIAIIVGLTLVNLVQPGMVDGQPAKAMLGLSAETANVLEQVKGRSGGDVIAVFLRMVPPNIVRAAADGQMLGLIFFGLLFGYFMSSIQREYAQTLQNFWQGVFEVMMRITELIMKFAPIGVFALVAKVVAVSGLDAFLPLAVFFFTVLVALLLHLFVVMPLILWGFGGVYPWRHFQAMFPALLTAFSTSSSSATLPVTLECVEKNAGVSNRVTSFVLPLGATVNMDGTALYECVAAMFITQAYGIELTVTQQFTVVLLALMTSIGVAGIPAASLVAITIILAAIGLPAEAIGLILAVDRLLDMCRTAVNVFSDSCGAVVIGRSEGEQGILRPLPQQG